MPLLSFGIVAYPEIEMQNNVINFIENYSLQKRVSEGSYSHWVDVSKDIFSEVHNAAINRRSDIIVWLDKKRLVNIECKISDVGGVIWQAKDHLCWADYSYICMPHQAYIAPGDIAKMVGIGLGLFLYDDENKKIYEAIYAKFNRSANKKFKEQAVKKLQSIINKKEEGIQLQCVKTS